tara:strand:- start:425 stop:1015 length:591 start_codon:yes stop_codon:yes gene_type:complete
MAVYGGLRPYISGPISGEPIIRGFKIASAEGDDLFQGDTIQMEAAGSVTVNNADAALNIVGVLAGVNYTNADGERVFTNKYNVDTTRDDNIAFVYTNPFQQYIIRCTDGAGANGTITQAAIGMSADFDTTNAGNGTTGLSGITMENDTLATQARVRIVGVSNEDGSDPLMEAAATTYTHAIVTLDPATLQVFNAGV